MPNVDMSHGKPGGAKMAEKVAEKVAEKGGQKMRALLRARLGDDVFSSFFNSLEFDSLNGTAVRFSVPQKFLQNWIQSHYTDALLECARAEFADVERVDVVLRQPGGVAVRAPMQAQEAQPTRTPGVAEATAMLSESGYARSMAHRPVGVPGQSRTEVGGFEGSPLDPRYTFDSFVLGSANRLAQAAAKQVAETATSESRSYNPLYIHSSVGLGKTHLLHAIAWEVRNRTPSAKLLYLTAERFRYQFVEALR
ncbi:MAG: DnaA/Hda family protein, partial [Vicinamibacterales bacterium]